MDKVKSPYPFGELFSTKGQFKNILLLKYLQDLFIISPEIICYDFKHMSLNYLFEHITYIHKSLFFQMVITYLLQDHLIFVGVDQFENEDLIKYSIKFMENINEKLIWFHADSFSSPHAYIRLKEGELIPPPNLIQVCCQICKEGSIKGCKEAAIDIVYCESINLSKKGCQNPGQVTYNDHSACKYIRGVKKNNQILKMIEKIKGETTLQILNQELDDLIINKRKMMKNEVKKQAEEVVEQKRQYLSKKAEMLEGMDQAGDVNEDDFI